MTQAIGIVGIVLVITEALRDGNERFYGYPFGSAQLVLEGEAATPHDADAVARWRVTLANAQQVTAWQNGP